MRCASVETGTLAFDKEKGPRIRGRGCYGRFRRLCGNGQNCTLRSSSKVLTGGRCGVSLSVDDTPQDPDADTRGAYGSDGCVRDQEMTVRKRTLVYGL